MINQKNQKRNLDFAQSGKNILYIIATLGKMEKMKNMKNIKYNNNYFWI